MPGRMRRWHPRVQPTLTASNAAAAIAAAAAVPAASALPTAGTQTAAIATLPTAYAML